MAIPFSYTTEIETREVPIIYPDETDPEEDGSLHPKSTMNVCWNRIYL